MRAGTVALLNTGATITSPPTRPIAHSSEPTHCCSWSQVHLGHLIASGRLGDQVVGETAPACAASTGR